MNINVTFYDFLRDRTHFIVIYLPSSLEDIFYGAQCFFLRNTGKQHLANEETLHASYQLKDGDNIVYINVQTFAKALLYQIQHPCVIKTYYSSYVVAHLLNHALTCKDPTCTINNCCVLRRMLRHYQGCFSCDCWEYGVCCTLRKILETYLPKKKRRKRNNNIFLGDLQQLKW